MLRVLLSPDLPDGVVERIPFIELNVMRLHNGSLTFSIYRKKCNAGNYVHAFSYQPLSQKKTVIRNFYLRAYRYCDIQFIKEEEETIRQNFLQLGYTPKFIERCRFSAYKGRHEEIKKENLLALDELPFASHSSRVVEKEVPIATISLPYHPCMLRLKPRLAEMGIRLALSSNSTLRHQLRGRTTPKEQPKGSVYVVNCSGCPKVYVGQTGKHVEERMEEHSRGPTNDTIGAVSYHNTTPGHVMDLRNPTRVFKSDCKFTRVTVEAALIHAAPTVLHNTASSTIEGNDLVAPLICKLAKPRGLTGRS